MEYLQDVEIPAALGNERLNKTIDVKHIRGPGHDRHVWFYKETNSRDLLDT